jgi:mRNA-degrading endonuclease RelE of RelBE toxin-antitoxin system
LFFDVFGTRKCITEIKELKKHFAKIIKEHKETLDENDARDFIDAYQFTIGTKGLDKMSSMF